MTMTSILSQDLSRVPAHSRALVPAIRQPLRAIQVGLGWFPEQPGGLDRYFYGLCQNLGSAKVNCSGLVVGTKSVAAESEQSVKAFASPDASLYARWVGARTAVREIRASADLVASHFALYTFPLLQLVRNLPMVVHFHGPWAAECRNEGGGRLSTALKQNLERAVYRRADRLIVLSRAFERLLVERYGIPAHRVHRIPGGVDTARFAIPQSRAEARAELGWPGDRPIVLAVRRLVNRMGLEDLIDAAETLRRRVPDALVMIAGRGRLAATLGDRIRSKGLANHVRLLGFVPDDQLPLAYRAADVSIVPSTALEGFGLIAAESLASGTPVLVTPIGGLPEVVEQLAPQLVLSAAGAPVLADAMAATLLGSLALPNAAACTRHARDHFDWRTVAAQVRAVYDDAVGLRPGAQTEDGLE